MADRAMKSSDAHALYNWLTVRKCAGEIGMSLEYVREEIRSGHLRASDFGRGKVPVYRIRPEDWADWLRAHERKAS